MVTFVWGELTYWSTGDVTDANYPCARRVIFFDEDLGRYLKSGLSDDQEEGPLSWSEPDQAFAWLLAED